MSDNKISLNKKGKLDYNFYLKELEHYQVELVKLQYWIKETGAKVIVLFEGRDAAGKGGVIKRITEKLNPRVCKVVALGTPTNKEQHQWYFQRYVAQLPAAGEMVLMDRSWYNRAGVERVMGFCSDDEYWEFLRSCPNFERMLIRSGIILIKFWFSISQAEQERRFQERIKNPTKRWKFSDMDVQSRDKWVEYSKAKDEMLSYTDTKISPWYVVDTDDKRKSRLMTIRHMLDLIPFKDIAPEPMKLPPRKRQKGYVRPPMQEQTFVKDYYAIPNEKQ